MQRIVSKFDSNLHHHRTLQSYIDLMTSQKHLLDKEADNNFLLRIDVQKINEKDHVGVITDKRFQDKDPKISRRVIRGLRNELAQLINQQKDNGADITEFEHVLYRNESETEEDGNVKQRKGTIYDKSNGKVYVQNGRPQIRCPSKGLRVLPRLDYANRYSAKTGKPLNRSEAKLEDVFFRTPLPKKFKTSLEDDGNTTEENDTCNSRSMTESSENESSARSSNSVSRSVQPEMSSSRSASREKESQEDNLSEEEHSKKSFQTSQSQHIPSEQSSTQNSMEEAVSIIISQNFIKLKERNGTENSFDDSGVSGLFAQSEELD